jgi:hypothetical protein
VALDLFKKLIDRASCKVKHGSLSRRCQLSTVYLKNDWFSCVWVVQKVALAKEVLIRCGAHESHFFDLVDAMGLVRSEVHSLGPVYECLADGELFPGSLQQWSDVWLTISLLNGGSSNGKILGNRMSLQNLVTSLVHCQTTNHRDIIYALLSLAKVTETP